MIKPKVIREGSSHKFKRNCFIISVQRVPEKLQWEKKKPFEGLLALHCHDHVQNPDVLQ